MHEIQRHVLLNPGPATTTDTVKWAQVVPDICPREAEFSGVMRQIGADLLRIAHAPAEEYAAVLFCGSGSLGMDVCLNSLLPEKKRALIICNGVFSERAVEICRAYGLPHLVLELPETEAPTAAALEQMLRAHPDIGLVYTTHQETASGLLNPIRLVGELAHRYGALSVVDTTSTFAMLPLHVLRDHIDFCMSSSQKGLMSTSGLTFIIGRRAAIEASQSYPQRSYYANLYRQYSYFEATGQMHFTPPVQTVYATAQALREYFAEGEAAKWARHTRVFEAIMSGVESLGLRCLLSREQMAGLVAAVLYPQDPRWDFQRVHDYCYARGFTIYAGKTAQPTFRLAAMGAIDTADISAFWRVFREALAELGMLIPGAAADAR